MPISHQIEGNDPSQHLGYPFIIIIISSCSTLLDFFLSKKSSPINLEDNILKRGQ